MDPVCGQGPLSLPIAFLGYKITKVGFNVLNGVTSSHTSGITINILPLCCCVVMVVWWCCGGKIVVVVSGCDGGSVVF